MPTRFDFAPPNVIDLLQQVLTSWHPRLHEADVRILVLMATNPDGPAIMGHGYPAAATMKVLGPKARVSERCEAELVIDAVAFHELSEESRLALLDHECCHADLVDLKGKVLNQALTKHATACKIAEEAGDEPPPFVFWKRDGRGRPCLRSVKGDVFTGDAFAAVIQRHGENAVEYRNIQSAYDWASTTALFNNEKELAGAKGFLK
jgi:hypothetical protein